MRDEYTLIENKEDADTEILYFENMKLSAEIINDYRIRKQYVMHKTDMFFPKLVYRYSYGMCTGCIQEDLFELRDFQLIVGKEKILVLPGFEESRNTKIYLKSELEDFNFQNIPIDSLMIPIGRDGLKRYFAILNQYGDLDMIYFPVRGHQDETRYYFSIVKDVINEMLP